MPCEVYFPGYQNKYLGNLFFLANNDWVMIRHDPDVPFPQTRWKEIIEFAKMMRSVVANLNFELG